MQKIPIEPNEKEQIRFLYLSGVFFLWLKMLILYKAVFQISAQSLAEELAMALSSFASAALLLGIGMLFKDRSKVKAILIIHFLLSFLLFGNVLYYRFYIDFITVPVLLQFQNVGGLSQSTLELIKLPDLLLFADAALMIIIARKKWRPFAGWQQSRWLGGKTFAVLIAFSLAASVLVNPGFWHKSYDRELIVKSLGLFHYHLYDLFLYSKASVNRVMADDTEVREISRYASSKQKHAGESDLHGIARGKNVIVIFLESTQSFVIDRKINNEEVTPFLNQLKEESLYFPNFYHQTAQGKTSDAEFILDNSLYPLPGGSVFVRRPMNVYHSLPKILNGHGYYAASFHGNDAQFWNRSNMYETLGYDRFFSKEYYDVTQENSVNYGLKDIPFFEQSIPYLNSLPQPFYAKFLTLTNHFPFLLNPEDQFISEAQTEQGLVNRYFTTVRYQDEAVKTFFDQIKGTDLYENSIFILFGDHYGISKSYNEALGQVLGKEVAVKEHVDLQKVPLIIHIPGLEGKQIDSVGGQVDLRPTILDLMGIEEPENSAFFGTSLLAGNRQNLVIFRDGTFVTSKYLYSEGACLSKKTGEKVKRNKCTPYFDQVQNELNYSDKVIFGDLLRFSNNEE
ncbi:MAG TPA: LTA synthase family protein [Bacillaceae bacterium]